jgi:hypothetical protein
LTASSWRKIREAAIEQILHEIIDAKRHAGELAILHLAVNDLCHLWGSRPTYDNEIQLLGSWKLNKHEREELVEMDLCYLSIQPRREDGVCK